jgi:acyl-CoA reductase-like NAD-dependent aldehyde dehydrogenase
LIIPLLKWSDEEDVIERANDTRYGLGASVWGKDQATVQRIGGQSGITTLLSMGTIMKDISSLLLLAAIFFVAPLWLKTR